MDDQGEMGSISACLLVSRGHLLFGTKKQVAIWGKELIFPPMTYHLTYNLLVFFANIGILVQFRRLSPSFRDVLLFFGPNRANRLTSVEKCFL